MKKYEVRISKKALKQLEKMDKPTQKVIRAWINKNLVGTENPRQYGKALEGNLSDKWSYRLGNYRILAEIYDDEIMIFIFALGHRREIYKNQK